MAKESDAGINVAMACLSPLCINDGRCVDKNDGMCEFLKLRVEIESRVVFEWGDEGED